MLRLAAPCLNAGFRVNYSSDQRPPAYTSMTRYPALSPLHPSIPATDGVILRGTLTYPHGQIGTKYPLAVLAHQYPSTHDSFAPFCADLHALGVATLAFDLRGHGKSIWTTSG